MDRERMLGPADGAAEQGESFIEEHDRRWGRFGVVGLGLVCYVAFRLYTSFADDVRGPSPSQLEQALAAGAAELRPQLPLKIDDATTLTAVSVEGRRVTYEATLAADLQAAEIPEAERTLTRHNSRELCADPEMRRAIEAGARFGYRVRDASGDVLRSETFTCPPAGG